MSRGSSDSRKTSPSPLQSDPIRWRILVLLFGARVGTGFMFQTTASVGDGLAVAFGLDYARIGWLVGLFMLPGLFLALPAGFANRFTSDRIIVGLALAALALGGILSGSAQSSGMIGLGRVVSGAGFVFTTLYLTKMVADWFDGREIATAMSILVMSWPLGIALGQVAHAWLALHFGWPLPFLVAAAFCAVAAVLVLLFYQAPHAQVSRSPSLSFRLSGREWVLILCAGLGWGVFNAGYVLYLTFGPRMLETLGETSIAAASITSIGSWLMLASGALCGYLVDRFGHREAVLTLCVSCGVLALYLLSLPGLGVFASVLFGLLGVAPAGLIIALSGEAVAPERRAFGMGVFFTIYYALMLASPPLGGAILDATGRVQDTLIFAMTLFAATIPAALLFRRLKR